MSYIHKLLKKISLIVIPLTLIACGGGSSDPADPGPAPDPIPATPDPADRFVYSGNADGTISILKVDNIAGFATPLAFFKVGAQSVRDMIYDRQNKRLVLLDSSNVHTLSVDESTGQLTLIDSRSTSIASFASHITLNSTGTVVYAAVGSGGASQFVDAYTINTNGTLSSADTTTLTVDPDYIKLNPAGDKLYVVSRSDDEIHAYNIAADGSLSASPLVISTDTNPNALLFNASGTIAYLLRGDNSGDSLEVFDVAANGNFSSRKDFENVGSSAIDMVISEDGQHLYAIDSGSDDVYHLNIDQASGELTYVNDHNLSFTPTDIALSYTGEEMYISHSEDDVVSTTLVDANDGTLMVQEWVRVFDSAQSIAAIGNDDGALQLTPSLLLAPDKTGLSIYTVGDEGVLGFVSKQNTNSALIDGQVAVDYREGLLLAAGEDSASSDILSSYQLDIAADSLSQVESLDATINSDSNFERIQVGKSGRFMYVLDKEVDLPDNGTIRVYSYGNDGDITATAIDTQGVGDGPENLSMHPAGQYLYSLNSFGDSISVIRINSTTGHVSLTSTNSISSAGDRPHDLVFHPNGRFAYVSVENDGEVNRFDVDDDGSLDNVNRTSAPNDNVTPVEPGPMAMHPSGKYLYVGERNAAKNISVYAINQSNFSLSFVSRVDIDENPSWLEIDPLGRFMYVRYSSGGNVELFNINQSDGSLASANQTVNVGDQAGFLPTLTLASPLQ